VRAICVYKVNANNAITMTSVSHSSATQDSVLIVNQIKIVMVQLDTVIKEHVLAVNLIHNARLTIVMKEIVLHVLIAVIVTQVIYAMDLAIVLLLLVNGGSLQLS
jgi:hypothetical protein